MAESNFSPVVASEPATRYVHIRAVGAAAGTPVKVLGSDITITRTGVGVWRLTFAYQPSIYRGMLGMPFFEDTGAAATVKGFTASATPYAAATRTMDISFWSSAFAATDLAATTTVSFTLLFKTTGV